MIFGVVLHLLCIFIAYMLGVRDERKSHQSYYNHVAFITARLDEERARTAALVRELGKKGDGEEWKGDSK